MMRLLPRFIREYYLKARIAKMIPTTILNPTYVPPLTAAHNPNVMAGYELEHVHPLTRREFKMAFAAHFGVDFNLDWPSWDAKDDCTIGASTASSPRNGHELTTPPIALKDTLGVLKNIFQWMEDTGAETNTSTGLHTGFSIQGVDLRQKCDPLKLIMLVPDDELLRLWGRQNKISSATRYIKQMMSSQGGKSTKDAYSCISVSRYSINLGNYVLNTQNYIEFRTPGSTDYHKRFSDMEYTVLTFADALTAACTPGSRQEEFERNLRDRLGVTYEPYDFTKMEWGIHKNPNRR